MRSSGGATHLPSTADHTATYEVPANNAFWSITVYGADGYMKSVDNILNASNTKMNADGTFTVHFGSKEACGDVPNRLDAPRVGTSSCASTGPADHLRCVVERSV